MALDLKNRNVPKKKRMATSLQRAFGGNTFKWLCHAGDRPGLEPTRTLQYRGAHLGIDVYMKCTITGPLRLETVYIEADRFCHRMILLAIRRWTIHIELRLFVNLVSRGTREAPFR
jgi:hypothetical protein